MEAFLKFLESPVALRDALQAVERSRKLRGTIAPITAVSCGVVPLDPGDRVADERLFLALSRTAHPDVPEALSEALGRPVQAVRCDPDLVRDTIERVYVRDRGINLQTFQSPEFLKTPDSAKLLLDEKVELIPEIHQVGGPEEVTFVDVSLHSILENLDRSETLSLAAYAGDLGFKIEDDGPLIFRDEPLEDDTRLVLQRSFYYDGIEHVQGIVVEELSDLPSMLHPTEIQITGIAADGTLTIHVYDHTQEVGPGGRAVLETEYFYLRYGMRYRRKLILKVNAVWHGPREALRFGRFSDHYDAQDIGRLFGLEFPA